MFDGLQKDFERWLNRAHELYGQRIGPLKT